MKKILCLALLFMLFAPLVAHANTWAVYTNKYVTPASYADYIFEVVSAMGQGTIGTRPKMFQYQMTAQKADGSTPAQWLTVFAPQKHAKGTVFHFVREFEIETDIWKLMMATVDGKKVASVGTAEAPGGSRINGIHVAVKQSDKSVCLRALKSKPHKDLSDQSKWGAWTDFSFKGNGQVVSLEVSITRQRGSNNAYNVQIIARTDSGALWLLTAQSVKHQDLDDPTKYGSWTQFDQP